MKLKEWQKHVKIGRVDMPNTAWCGAKIYEGIDWVFSDAEHAALNGRDQGRLTVCPACRAALVTAITNGADSDDEPDAEEESDE